MSACIRVQTGVGGVGLADYMLDELARLSGVSARNIRAYRERGLLDPPRRVGRSAYYGERHLVQLKAISQLLAKGFNSVHIAEFFDGLRDHRGLAEVLGVQPGILAGQPIGLDIDPAGDDAQTLIEHGLAAVVDGTVVLIDPALGGLLVDVVDQPRYVQAIALIARAAGASADDLAAATAAAVADVADVLPARSQRTVGRSVARVSLDRALQRWIAADQS